MSRAAPAVTFGLALASLGQRPVRTSLTAVGIAVAVAGAIVFLSLGEGIRRVFADQLANLGPDIQVTYGPASGDFFPTTPDLPGHYLQDLTAAAPALGIRSVVPVLVYLRGGFSPSSSFVIEGLPAAVDLGELFHGATAHAGRGLVPSDEGAAVAVVGSSAAERGGLDVGSPLRLNPTTSLEVVGIVGAGGGLLDNLIVVPLTTLQAALGVTDRYSLLAVSSERPERAEAVAAAVRERFPALGARTSSELFAQVNASLRVSDVVRLGISAIALIVGAIAVANTVMMSVFERTREFGVIRAMGARPRFLFGLVLTESALLAVAGAAVGVLLGGLGVRAVNHLAYDYVGLHVALLTPRLVAFAVLVALAMGLLSGLVPAARAARLGVAAALARE